MLQSLDFKGFANFYNGPGRAATYERRFRQALQAYRRLRPSRPAPSDVPVDGAPAPSFGAFLSRIMKRLFRS